MTLPLGFSLSADFFGKGWLFSLILVALALLIFVAHHRKKGSEAAAWAGIRVIVLLRVMSVFLLLLLVFNPQLSLTHQQVHPKRLALLMDLSASMLNAWEDPQAFQSALQPFISNVEKTHQLDIWSLDGQRLRNLDQAFSDQQTVFAWTPQFGREDDDIGDIYSAVLLLGDGHLNGGRSPLDQAWSETLPIYPILPLAPVPDQYLRLLDLTYSSEKEDQNRFNAYAKFQQSGLQGRQIRAQFYYQGVALNEPVTDVLRSAFSDLKLPLQLASNQDQKVTLRVEVEGTALKLESELLIKARNDKLQILLVSERVNALHKFILMSYPDSLVDVYALAGTTSKPEDDPGGPDNDHFDLVILNQITEKFSKPAIFQQVKEASQAGSPAIVFLDPTSPMSLNWAKLFGLNFENSPGMIGEFSLEWTQEVLKHPLYLGLMGQGMKYSDLLKVSPILRPTYSVTAPGTIVWNLGVGSSATPALILSDRPSQAVFAGGNFWKLFFNPDSKTFFETTWTFLNDYLREIAEFKPVKIRSMLESASTGSLVPLEVHVKDIRSEAIRNAEIRVWQEDALGNQTRLELTDSRPGIYSAHLQTLKAGPTMVIAEAYRFGELWGRDTSKIELMAFSGENQSKGVDRVFLNRLAQRSGGQVVQLDADILPAIPYETYTSIHQYTWSGLRSRIWFVLLVLLLASEWIIRRRQGLL